jgi:hypothetical protein
MARHGVVVALLDRRASNACGRARQWLTPTADRWPTPYVPPFCAAFLMATIVVLSRRSVLGRICHIADYRVTVDEVGGVVLCANGSAYWGISPAYFLDTVSKRWARALGYRHPTAGLAGSTTPLL